MAEECSNCSGKHGVYKVNMDSYRMSDPGKRGEQVYFCCYCGGSLAGNVYLFPDQYPGAYPATRVLAEMMNLLEDRLRATPSTRTDSK